MRNIVFIKEDVADRITCYHLLVFVAALPFDRLYSELALISLALHTIINFRREYVRSARGLDFLVCSSVYLLTIIATAYSSFKQEAFGEWERQAALIVFPLIVLLNRFDFRKYALNIVLVMAFSCAITIVCLYFSVFRVMLQQGLPISAMFSNAFINHNFAAPIDMHATYFSMYIALGATGVFRAFVETQKRNSKILYMVALIILIAGLIQLSSRAVMISFVGIVVVVVPFFFLPRQKRWFSLAVSGIAIVAALLVLSRTDSLHTRVIVELREDLTQADANNNLLEPRMARWRAAKKTMLQSPLYGYGSGSEIPLLKEVYFENRLYNSYLNSLNIHNQYLSMIIKTGVVGLIVLLIMFFAAFKRSVKSSDGLFFAFLIIVATVSFSENILDGNKGIFFFAFFFTLFYAGGDRKGSYSKIKLLQ